MPATQLIKLLFLYTLLYSVYNSGYASENRAVSARDTTSIYPGWERFSLSAGAFVASQTSELSIGSRQLGLGVQIDLEDALNLQTRNTVFRIETEYSFGRRKRSIVKFGYFSLERNANKILEADLELGDYTYPVGTELTSSFGLSIFSGAYEYSFYQDDRFRMGASLGLFVMPIRFEISGPDISGQVTDFTAPLPVLGFRTSLYILPKLMLKQGLEILYLNFEALEGSIVDLNIDLEYSPFPHISLGMGIDAFRMNISAFANGTFIKGFVGNFQTGITGLLVFGKYYF